MDKESSYYTLTELAKTLRLCSATLRGYVKRGDLKAIKVGKKYLVTEANFTAFLDARRRS